MVDMDRRGADSNVEGKSGGKRYKKGKGVVGRKRGREMVHEDERK